ncbi:MULTISPECIES: EscU/YscU/HrcU family type III secretion system export apparatus switch protein [Thalassospira]|uniref:Flagellar biosynthesis protein FlhB n=2 Tax=Thalassospira TaxID=168934 RepID=A0A367W9U1_9PROT|nr:MULTISPECIES: EscU/YscU/HrcU family type III secretion system export apparatus switch protein [Thalassospira]MDG4718280.1 EscU/YscU/HrcU family type III secretion system export apparatus switch protein [Thalassospira sp. FZY0004]RCK38029.1 flagellar biosynthesis protein FlhB [Thalassospira profundimaris]
MSANKPTYDITDQPASKTENLAAPGEQDQKAVALRYAHGRDNAPILSAKGAGSVAEQILQVAFANGIKVRKDSDLAEILMAVDVDSEIPLEAFAAVAEILNYIYRINRIYGGSSRSKTEPQDEVTAATSFDRNVDLNGKGQS